MNLSPPFVAGTGNSFLDFVFLWDYDHLGRPGAVEAFNYVLSTISSTWELMRRRSQADVWPEWERRRVDPIGWQSPVSIQCSTLSWVRFLIKEEIRMAVQKFKKPFALLRCNVITSDEVLLDIFLYDRKRTVVILIHELELSNSSPTGEEVLLIG